MNKMMEYKGYHALIEYDADDMIFIGKVYGITDSLNFHGTSVTELEKMFHQSIDNYLAMCEETGKKPDKEYKGSFNIRIPSAYAAQTEYEYKGSFNIRIPSALHKQISIHAAEEGLTLNQYVMRALEKTAVAAQDGRQNGVIN